MSKRAKATLSITLQNNDVLRFSLQKADGSCHVEHHATWEDLQRALQMVMPVAIKRRQHDPSKVVNRASGREVADLVRYPALDTFVSSQSQISHAMNRPLLGSQGGMLAQYGFDPAVIYSNSIRGCPQSALVGDVRNRDYSLVNHECRVGRDDSLVGTKVSNHRGT